MTGSNDEYRIKITLELSDEDRAILNFLRSAKIPASYLVSSPPAFITTKYPATLEQMRAWNEEIKKQHAESFSSQLERETHERATAGQD
jgi:hypothetical protein